MLFASDDLAAENAERFLDAANDLHTRQPLDLVLAADVAGQLLLAKIRDQLVPPVFPMPDVATLRMLNDKWEFHQACRAWGIETPNTQFFAKKADIDLEQVTQSFQFPLIAKPVSQYGSIGVRRLDTVAALVRDVLKFLTTITVACSCKTMSGGVMSDLDCLPATVASSTGPRSFAARM